MNASVIFEEPGFRFVEVVVEVGMEILVLPTGIEPVIEFL